MQNDFVMFMILHVCDIRVSDTRIQWQTDNSQKSTITDNRMFLVGDLPQSI